MAVKRLHIEGIGTVTLQKRRGTRNIRLLIRGNDVKVTMPLWAPYSQALEYLESKKQWIKQHLGEMPVITDGSYIGKSHQLRLEPSHSGAIQTRVTTDSVIVKVPKGGSLQFTDLQHKILTASERALRAQSSTLVAPRVSDLALEHGFEHRNISFKKLKSRWGSCDHDSNLVFNIYLVQLPWELIDYVIIHELAHTKHHNHSREFWDVVKEYSPDYKRLRKSLKSYHPHVIPIE